MRACIVALDALEYTIVDRGDYPNLKQAEYGKVEVNVYPLSTPTIWASFITGLPPEKHGVIAMHKWDRWIEWLLGLSLKLGLYKTLRDKGYLKGKGKALEGLGLAHRRMYSKEDFKAKGVPTIFDYMDKKVIIGVPSYDDWRFSKFIHVIGNPIKEKLVAEEMWERFYHKKERALELLDSDWNLFMVHFFIADVIQHLWWYKEDRIAELYEELEKTVGQIKMKLPENTFTLVVSDHGLLRGEHTPYAFYSCSEPLNLRNPKITDFFDIILQKLGVPSRREVEEIKNRLRSLGY